MQQTTFVTENEMFMFGIKPFVSQLFYKFSNIFKFWYYYFLIIKPHLQGLIFKLEIGNKQLHKIFMWEIKKHKKFKYSLFLWNLHHIEVEKVYFPHPI